MPSDLSLSVIIPVYNGGAAFQRCLAAFAGSTLRPYELIVVDDGSTDGSRRWAQEAGACLLATGRPGSGPALARNLGARHAGGDLLFFCDADVEVRPDTLARIREAFAADPGLAALFGSYDDAPGDPGFVSQYKNLMHHYVHQQASEDASTFWAGCGAVRRELFLHYDGFSSRYTLPSIEDIELGAALARDGHPIRLDKSLQVKHLKRWTLAGLLRSDVLARGVPWTRLILRTRRMPNDLNLRTSSRASVALAYLGLLGLALGFWWPAAWAVGLIGALLLLWLNGDVYRFFRQKRGFVFMLGAAGMHWLYYLYSGLAFGLGVVLHLSEALRTR
jgi:glycosyltransferase involved in cell wall biosynthesis